MYLAGAMTGEVVIILAWVGAMNLAGAAMYFVGWIIAGWAINLAGATTGVAATKLAGAIFWTWALNPLIGSAVLKNKKLNN